jgi:hypothetical protein
MNAGKAYIWSLVAASLTGATVAGIWIVEKRFDWIFFSVFCTTAALAFEAHARWDRSRAKL